MTRVEYHGIVDFFDDERKALNYIYGLMHNCGMYLYKEEKNETHRTLTFAPPFMPDSRFYTVVDCLTFERG